MTQSAQPIARARALVERVVPRGAILLSALTFASYGMGLVRDRILTRTFGAGAELDTFNAAFVIPELTFGVIVASGLAAPFIPSTALPRPGGCPDCGNRAVPQDGCVYCPACGWSGCG